MDWAIKFWPIPPRSPHPNGKLERTHRANREDFWDTVDPKDPEIEAKLSEGQHHRNWHRPHWAVSRRSTVSASSSTRRLSAKLLRRPTTAAASASGLPITGWPSPRLS
jgi:hypothetical protein